MIDGDRKKILLILPYGGVGGMERLAETFYRTYRSQGHVVKVLKVIQLPNDVVNFGEDELCLSTRDLHTMRPLARLWFYLMAPLRIRAHILENGITHSIAFGDVANLFSAMTRTSEFKVASIHALKSVELSHRTAFARVTKIGYLTFYRAFDRVVSISSSIREDLIAHCGYAFPERLEVVYNPHDVGAILQQGLQPLPSADQAIFSKPAVIFLGRLSPQKAPWRLVEAFSRLVDDGVDANLLFVGDGDEAVVRRVRALVRQAGLDERVFFIGRQGNPYRYLARSAVLALTSAYEGTPNVIVEAIALRVPVVSSYCTGGIAELMCVSGQVDMTADAVREVDAGFITPHFPEAAEDLAPGAITGMVAEALKMAIEQAGCRKRLSDSRDALLGKFQPETAAARYIGIAR